MDWKKQSFNLVYLSLFYSGPVLRARIAQQLLRHVHPLLQAYHAPDHGRPIQAQGRSQS